MPVLPGGEIAIGPAAPAFDPDLRLIDPVARDKLATLLKRFGPWIAANPASPAKDTP